MKIKKLSFYLTLLLFLSSFVLNDKILIYIALFLVISIGILHGANDILLIQKTNFISKSNKFLSEIIYTLIVLFAIAVFYFIPFYALIFFILFSAYHFGEQHLSNFYLLNRLKLLKAIHHFLFGLTILGMLFWFKPIVTNQVVFDLAHFEVPIIWYQYIFIVSLICSIVVASLLLFFKAYQLAALSAEYIMLLLYALVFYFSPLLFGFAIYFALWHSLPSLSDQIEFVYKVNFLEGFKRYFKDAAMYWLVSVIGFAVFLYFFYETKLFYSFLFTFIAAITFPHVIVMGKMFNYLKDKT